MNHRQSHHGHGHHAAAGAQEGEGEVAAHAALLKSAMMEMEKKRLGACTRTLSTMCFPIN